MDFGLYEEQELIASTIRRLSDRELCSLGAAADRKGVPPPEIDRIGAELGFFLDAVPEESGGLLDGDYAHLTRALRSIELGRGCAALAALLEGNVEPALATAAWGSDAAKATLFGALTAGRRAATAHDFAGSLALRETGAGLAVSGDLGPIPLLADASHVLISAPHATQDPDGPGPALFLLPVDTGALTRLTPSGWRAARWARLRLDDAPVPEELVLCRGEAAREASEEVLAWYRVALAARAVGAAEAALEHARRYGEERIQFGRPIGSFESLVEMLDAGETDVFAARLFVLEAAWQIDGRRPEARDRASRARDLACRTLSRVAIDAVQVFGGYGFVKDFPVEKIMRDARPFEALLGNESFDRVLARSGPHGPTQA